MRVPGRARSAALVLALAISSTLSACTAESEPQPATAATGPCLGDLGYPGLPVQELNESLPIHGVQDAFVQYELAVGRGPGGCDQGEPPAKRDCPIPRAASEDTIDLMLDRSPDELTEAEFARGATAALTEMVTGRTDDGGTFQYRITAWHYPADRPPTTSMVLAAVRACAGADEVAGDGDDVEITVTRGSDPVLVAYSSGSDVFLIESIENVAPDGTVGRISDTTSGLLPADAIDAIRQWWTERAADYLSLGAIPA